jgi:hypothetical protein
MDQVNQNHFLGAQPPWDDGPAIEAINQRPLAFYKAYAFFIRLGRDVNEVIDPAKVGIGFEKIRYQGAVNHQTRSVISLLAARSGD